MPVASQRKNAQNDAQTVHLSQTFSWGIFSDFLSNPSSTYPKMDLA